MLTKPKNYYGSCRSAKCYKIATVSIGFLLCILLITYSVRTNDRGWQKYANTTPTSSVRAESLLTSVQDGNGCVLSKINAEPITGEKNIMFSETSCSLSQQHHVLNPRQACAIESAARTNPTHHVYLSYSCQSDGNIAFSPPYVKQLFTYPNVKFSYINVSRLVEGTGVEEWWATNPMTRSEWPVIHSSDLARLALLYKYGGIYMDLDVVVVRDFTGMENFVGAELTEYLACGLMGFRAVGVGHEVVGDFLTEFKSTFNGDDWGHNGPALIQRVMSRRCNVTEVPDMTPERCDGIKIMPPETFYPIYGSVFEELFQPDDKNGTFFTKLTSPSSSIKSVHLWNALSADTVVNVGSDQIYGRLAAMFCPKVYANCGKTF